MERDLRLAQESGVDAVFTPSVVEMYPPGFNTEVIVHELTASLCGAMRPGHFQGVTTVVAKLFNIVAPERAYFGQKDYQQAMVIQKMVHDLLMPLEVIVCPTVREADGLAMSSRNAYLNPVERQAAWCCRALRLADAQIVQGEHQANARRPPCAPALLPNRPALTMWRSVIQTLQEVDELPATVLVARRAYWQDTAYRQCAVDRAT
jgi:pantoate--beta-alanine ligase